MLILGVGLLIVIDIAILFTYTVVEGSAGNLGPRLAENSENLKDEEGVSINTCLYHGTVFMLVECEYT